MSARIRFSAERVAAEILDLDACDGPTLLSRWRSLTGRLPGPGLRGELLRWSLALKLQERALGGLSPVTLRRLASMAKAHEQGKAEKAAGNGGDEGHGGGSRTPSRSIKPGSRLIREWKGVIHEVVVEADSYLWNGNRHASLSTIAKAITGTQWNGWRFFGIDRTRRKAKAPVMPRKPALASAPIPGAVMPSVAIPGVVIPGVAIPGVAIPSVAVPTVNLPSAAVESNDAIARVEREAAHAQG